MHDQLNKRLFQLQQEYQKGQQKLEGLDNERKSLYETLLRISGAIQVLQEELDKAGIGELPLATRSSDVPIGT